MAEDYPDEYGLIDLAADGLRQHHRDGSPETLRRLQDHLLAIDQAAHALNSAEVLLTRVALLSELVRAGIEPAEALEAPVAQRAATLYLAQTQDLAKPGTASLEVWSIDLGVSLSRIPALPTHQASAIASVTCHLADIHSNGAALRHLLITSATPVWASPVRAQVIAAAWEHRDALAPDDLALLQRVVETLRHDHALDDPPLEEETLTDLRDGVANYAEMLAGGHYEAAELYLAQFLNGPGIVSVMAHNLRLLPRLHLGLLDDLSEAEPAIADLAAQLRLPEAPQQAKSLGIAAPRVLLRELIAHHASMGTQQSAHVVASAAEAICDCEVVRITAGDRPAEALAAEMVTVRQGLRSSRPAGSASTGSSVVHLVDVACNNQASVFARSLDRPGERTLADLIAFTGTRQRLLLRILREPVVVERLSGYDRDLLASCVAALVPAEAAATLIVPSSMLWSVPFEAFSPRSRVALSMGSQRILDSAPRLTSIPPRVCFVGDLTLPGAEIEKRALEELDRSDLIHLISPTTLAQLEDTLRGGEIDLLCLSLHGSSSGFAYSLQLGSDAISTQQLLQMPLPEVVVAAGCRSGRTLDRLNLATVLAARCPAVVVSLWDLDDRVGASTLVDFYRLMAVGRHPVRDVWHQLMPAAALCGLRLLTHAIVATCD